MAFQMETITKTTLAMDFTRKEARFLQVPSLVFFDDTKFGLFTLPQPAPTEMEVATAFIAAHPDYIIVTV